MSRQEGSVALTDEVRDFLLREPPWFATIATVSSDGSPRQAIIWYRLTDDGLIVNSLLGRRWPTDLLRDPRVSLSIGSDYEFISITGEAERVGDQEQAQADIEEMARRYRADDPDELEATLQRFRGQERISFLVRPRRLHVHL
jgi:PPOX class probable F420-dependent enzyme